MSKAVPKFSTGTIPFLLKAGRQKNPLWLERNEKDFEKLVRAPLVSMASHLKSALAPDAPGYHFPLKGIGRLRRPVHRVEQGGSVFRSWISYSASVPTGSRFDHNPNLYFMIDPHDDDDPVLVAGGLYMPSSRQLRAIREAIAEDASPFDRLFATKDFARAFPGGFSKDRTATRPPRGFDPTHPRMDWLKLQAYFVWKPYTKKQFYSAEFPKTLEADWRQILRLNELLTLAIQGRLSRAPGLRTQPRPKTLETLELDERLGEITARVMDF